MNFKNYVYQILIILIALFAVRFLFVPGFYTSHDGGHQLIRLANFHQGLFDGQIPVRWAGTALKGYGYPLFSFTYRLPFWFAEVFYLVFNNLATAIKATFIFTYVLSGFSFFYFSYSLYKSKLAAFLGTILYLWTPYRFVNIFVRASLGEAVTFVFIPLIFLGIYKLSKGKEFLKWEIFTGISLACLILSHALTAFIWLISLILWLGIGWFNSKKKKDYTISSFVSVLIALFLSAYYWLPAMVEKQFIKFSASIGDYYKAHFVTLAQLLYSRWGFGFSLPGTINDMMSFQIGIANWIVVVMAFLTLFVYLLIKSKLQVKSLSLLAEKFKNILNFKYLNWSYFGYFLFMFGFSVYLMLSPAAWFYEFIKKIQIIDIPWRFLGLTVFFTALLFSALTAILKQKTIKMLVGVLILSLTFYTNRNHLRVNKYVFIPDNECFQSAETSNEHDDYAPALLAVDQCSLDDQALMTVSGVSTNRPIKRTSNLFRFYSEVKSDKAEVIAKVAYYPGWEVMIDNKKGTILKDDGKIKVELDKGNHLITLLFRETGLRRFSNWLSLLTLLGIIIFVFKYGKDSKSKRS